MKKTYKELEMDVIRFTVEDILTTSDTNTNDSQSNGGQDGGQNGGQTDQGTTNDNGPVGNIRDYDVTWNSGSPPEGFVKSVVDQNNDLWFLYEGKGWEKAGHING